MIRKNKSFIAIIMAMIMIITSTVIYLPVSAKENSASLSSSVSSNDDDDQLMMANGQIISVLPNTEIVEMREENVKHFALENGKYQAVVYGDPVHRKDENGAWQDIDNRLYLKNKKGVSVYETENGRISFVSGLSYTTTQSSFFSASSKIPLGTSQAHVMSLSENGYSISFSLVSNICAVSVAEVSNHETRDVSQATSQIIDNKTSLIYQNAWQNVDLEYLLVSNDVKENIIVKAPSTEYSYSFLLTLDRLIPEQNEAGVIMLRDEITEEVMYYMPAPYMYDAKGETSYDVDYSLVEIKNGNYLLNVTANSEWINDGGRAFPVTIDPTVKTNSVVYDTYISSTVPSGNYGFGENLFVSSTQTSFVSINMPTLPTNADILYAGLCLHYYIVGSGDYANLNVKRVLQPWTEGNLSYNTFSNNMVSSEISSQLTVHKVNGSSEGELGIASIDLTQTAADWYSGASNYGVAISYNSGNAYPVILKSYESHSFKPYYIITYSTTNYDVIPNVVNLIVNYDNAYLSRYPNAVSRIKNQMETLQELYYNEFDILVNWSIPMQYSSYADIACSTNPDAHCSHATNENCYASKIYTDGSVILENLHHKNIDNIIARMTFPNMESAVRLTYIGHLICNVYRDKSGNFKSHAEHNENGVSYFQLGVCTVMNFGGVDTETKTMIHEFGHLYGALDHYGGSTPSTQQMKDETGDNRFSEYCIYGEKRNDTIVLDNLLICDGCKARIESNRNRFSH